LSIFENQFKLFLGYRLLSVWNKAFSRISKTFIQNWNYCFILWSFMEFEVVNQNFKYEKK